MAITFADTERENAWRQDVRAFIDAEAPREPRTGVRQRPSFEHWRGRLASRGWIAPAWPRKFGGAEMTVVEQFIMNEEFAEAGLPTGAGVGGLGVMMLGPTLIEHGTEGQQAEHLGRILRGEAVWCQGYSEPGSGSDLASLQTRAVRDGDDYVVNGQKIWTTVGHLADWMFMLVRTDPEAPKHRGISYLLVDMKSPGITVRPLTTLAGTQTFSEVYFEDVRVPVSNRVGEENRGWYVGTTTLDFERSSIGSAIGLRKSLEELVAKAKGGTGLSLVPGSQARWEFVERWVETEVARMLSYRVVSMQAHKIIPNHEASISKMYTTELSQRIARLGLHLRGMHGNVRDDYSMEYMETVSATIAGGTTEIQKGIVATRGLGLPRG